MGRIFKNYKELISENDKLFNLLQKNGFAAIVKAVWFARQSEVDALNHDLTLLDEASQELDSRNLGLMSENETIVKDCEFLSKHNIELAEGKKKYLKRSKRFRKKCKNLEDDFDKLTRKNNADELAFSELYKNFMDIQKQLAGTKADLKSTTEERDLFREAASNSEKVARESKDYAQIAKKEKEMFEAQALQAKKNASDYREYAKELKDYATSLKKYPWEKRVSSTFSNEKVAKKMPKRATSLFRDM